MKFLVDVCVGKSVHQCLTDQGYDTVNVAERDPKMSDSDIMEWAFKDGRILVTLDKDFPELAYRSEKLHSGIVRLPNVDRKQRVSLIRIVLERHSEDLLKGAIVTVKPGKIRVTKAKP